MYGLKTDWPEDSHPRYMALEEYEGLEPRWCPGCGDHAVLTAALRLCRDEQLLPEKTVFVSGIGCSSRFPHYLKTYGFHGLHGRAMPVACGIRSRRPDLHVFVATGDGDSCSIGTSHWVHGIRYNMNMVMMLLDNNVYGLTKNQTSPTSRVGRKTNTHPAGALLDGINPVQTTLSITNVSFVAQIVDWNPLHLLSALKAAHRHPGLGFVRVIQRCPHYPTAEIDALQEDSSQLLLLTHPDGIEADDVVKRAFPNQLEHDPADLNAARDLAAREDVLPIGLLYRNENAPQYDELSARGLGSPRKDKIAAVRDELNLYKV
jgi:2-oxoglutarate ferredoxin oxidoreductase subunit beta